MGEEKKKDKSKEKRKKGKKGKMGKNGQEGKKGRKEENIPGTGRCEMQAWNVYIAPPPYKKSNVGPTDCIDLWARGVRQKTSIDTGVSKNLNYVFFLSFSDDDYL